MTAVERAAMARYDFWRRRFSDCPPWERLGDRQRADWIDDMRAAIASLRDAGDGDIAWPGTPT